MSFDWAVATITRLARMHGDGKQGCGKLLIGSAVDLPAMLNRQQAQLRFGAHPNAQLQADWNALGPDAFVVEPLEVLSPPDDPAYDPSADLDVLLALWLEKLSPFGDRGYNRPPRPS